MFVYLHKHLQKTSSENFFTQIRLNAHAPLKNKHLKANHATFVTKELQKAVMKRTKLRNG